MLPLITKSELELLISAFDVNTLLDSKNCEVLEDSLNQDSSLITLAFPCGDYQIKTINQEEKENASFI